MKTFFKVVLFVFVAAFYSCGKDEVSSASSSITTAGVISGTISNYSTIKVSSILFNSKFTSDVSSEGKFTYNLGTPELSELSVDNTVALVISDPKALIKFLDYVPCLNGIEMDGELMKTNITKDITTLEGTAISNFVYCDRDVTIKGTVSGEAENVTGSIIYDVKLKKGWNEMVLTIEKLSLITGDATMKVSNTIPFDLKWVYVGEDLAGTASKVKALKSLLKKQ